MVDVPGVRFDEMPSHRLSKKPASWPRSSAAEAWYRVPALLRLGSAHNGGAWRAAMVHPVGATGDRCAMQAR